MTPIEIQLKESFQKQSEDFYLSAVLHFNLHRLIDAQGSNILKPSKQIFYNEDGKPRYHVNEYSFDEATLYDEQQAVPFFSRYQDNGIQRAFHNFESPFEKWQGREDLELHYAMIILACYIFDAPGGVYRKYFTSDFSMAKIDYWPFDAKDKQAFLKLAARHYDFSLIYSHLYEILEHPQVNIYFEDSMADYQTANILYELNIQSAKLKSEEMRTLSYWFSVDGAAKIQADEGRQRGLAIMKEKKAVRAQIIIEIFYSISSDKRAKKTNRGLFLEIQKRIADKTAFKDGGASIDTIRRVLKQENLI